MIDLIYDFIYNTLLGNTTMPGAQDLATLLTYTTIVLIFFVLVKLVCWCFNVVGGRRKTRI